MQNNELEDPCMLIFIIAVNFCESSKHYQVALTDIYSVVIKIEDLKCVLVYN